MWCKLLTVPVSVYFVIHVDSAKFSLSLCVQTEPQANFRGDAIARKVGGKTQAGANEPRAAWTDVKARLREWKTFRLQRSWICFINVQRKQSRAMSSVWGRAERKHTHTHSLLLVSLQLTSARLVHWLFGTNKHKRSSDQIGSPEYNVDNDIF